MNEDIFEEDNIDTMIQKYMQTNNKEFDLHKALFNASQKTKYHSRKGLKLIVAAAIAIISMICGTLGTVALSSAGIVHLNRSPLEKLKEQYTIVSSFYNDSIFIFQDDSGKMGIVDIDGNIIVNDEYDQISPIRNNKFCVTKYDTDNNSSIGIIDDKGTVICPLNYNYMEFQYNYYTGEFSDVGIARQKDKSTYELINVDGKKYNDSEWLSASFYIINSVTGYKVDGKSYIFQKNEDGIFEESAHIMYNTQQQIIYGYNIKVLYNKASQNIEFQDKCNRFVIEYICALNEENLTVIEEKSTNNFYNGVKNIILSAYSAEERDYYSAKRLMGQKIEFFVQINTPEADQNTITSYVILCIGDDSYDVEINLIKDSQGNLLVSGLVY